MNRHRVDPTLEKDINALMVCAPLQCSREASCFRVARFARDRVRELHTQHAIIAKELEKEEELYKTSPYASIATWELAHDLS
jgi:hypothetical protein